MSEAERCSKQHHRSTNVYAEPHQCTSGTRSRIEPDADKRWSSARLLLLLLLLGSAAEAEMIK